MTYTITYKIGKNPLGTLDKMYSDYIARKCVLNIFHLEPTELDTLFKNGVVHPYRWVPITIWLAVTE